MEASERELLERGVAALEQLAADPVINVETKPPVCPHCEKINPAVRVDESSAEGKLAEFVIQAECQSCKKVFYAFPVQWEVAQNTEQMRQLVAERVEISGLS